MGIATVRIDGTEYTVQSGKNFRLGFVHYYVRLMHMDGINYTERTCYALAVYSGNASISFTCVDGAGNESRITATESTTGEHYAAAPNHLLSQLGHFDPVEISGFTDGTVFTGARYDLAYEDWAHDTITALSIGFAEAMAQMPPVCNAQFPVIVTQPTGKTVEQGAAVTLTCAAEVTDGGVLSYVWHSGDTIQGQGSSLTVPTDAVGEATYYCVVTNTLTAPGYGTDSSVTTSGTATVTVTETDTEEPDTGGDPDTPDQPAEKYPILDHISGYLMALCGRPIQWPKREPVAFLYNGVRLPGLPEWDKEAFPYAFICKKTDGTIVFSAENFARTVSANGTCIVYGHDHNCACENGAWVAGAAGAINCTMIWANHDIYGADDTLYLAASEPVPVYE